MDRYRNLTSRIDQIVNAVKNYNKQASFQINKSKRRLPSIKVLNKNKKDTKKEDHVDIQFFDKFSLFCDDKIIPIYKQNNIINAKTKNKNIKTLQSDLPYIRQIVPTSHQIQLPKLDNILSNKINKILESENIQRSKSTKVMTNRNDSAPLKKIVFAERRLMNKIPLDAAQQAMIVHSPKTIKKSKSDIRFTSRKIQTRLKNKRVSIKQQSITGWDVN